MKNKLVLAIVLTLMTLQPVQAEHPASSHEQTPAVHEQPSAAVQPAVPAQDDSAPGDIVNTAIAAGNFKTFVRLVQAAGLEETLKGKEPFTVFAPTDEAFSKLPAGMVDDLLKPENVEKLKVILTHHLLSGTQPAAELVAGMKKSLHGANLIFSKDKDQLRVDSANVIKPDIKAANGMIHAIDAVIVPGVPVSKPAADSPPKDHPAH